MAITGTKAFTSGEVLTANDVNQYLMRGVKVFSSTAVRDAAYGGAGEPVLEEGETCYITGTDELQTYNGTSWVKMGPTTVRILQVVQTVKTDTFSTTSTTFVDVTGMSVTITPSSTSSLILVMVDAKIGGVGFTKLQRGSTDIYVGDAAGSRIRCMAFSVPNSNGEDPSGGIFLDSPNTTSPTTYKIQIRGEAGGNCRVNRSDNDPDNTTSGNRVASSITVMEIAA